jgi:hypothetical protein
MVSGGVSFRGAAFAVGLFAALSIVWAVIIALVYVIVMSL